MARSKSSKGPRRGREGPAAVQPQLCVLRSEMGSYRVKRAKRHDFSFLLFISFFFFEICSLGWPDLFDVLKESVLLLWYKKTRGSKTQRGRSVRDSGASVQTSPDLRCSFIKYKLGTTPVSSILAVYPREVEAGLTRGFSQLWASQPESSLPAPW